MLPGPTFFCHIPKTGGTSLRYAIENAFDPGAVLPSNADIENNGFNYPDLEWLKLAIRERRDTVRLLRGHYQFSAHSLLPNAAKIVVLRDPVARSVSQINHMAAHNPRGPALLSRFQKKGIYPLPDNGMTRLLVGDQGEDGWKKPLLPAPNKVPVSAALDAIAAIEMVDVLGITERLDLLEKPLAEMGVSFSAAARFNRAKEAIALSRDQMDIIKEHNKVDQIVYDAAVKMLGL